MSLRHQLAVFSPITPGAIVAASVSAVGLGQDARPRVRDELMRLFHADECLLCDSGTHALQLAIQLARQSVGAEATVALPAFSCYDVATAAIGAGGPVALYDLNPASLAPDIESLQRRLTEGARIIVVAPLYGVPVDWDALRHHTDPFGAILIEDAAQGHGASWKGRPLGTLGSVTTMSFGRGKGWTSGGGGAVLLRGMSADITAQPPSGLLRELSTVAGLLIQATLGRPGVYGIPRSIPALHLGETTYVEPTSPRTMTRAAGAALLRTRDASLEEARVRAANAAMLLAGIEENDRIRTIAIPEGALPGYLRLPLRITGGMDAFNAPVLSSRLPSSAAKGAKRGICTLGIAASYPTTLADLAPLGRQLVGKAGEYPGARTLARDLVTLPTHSLVSDLERAAILAAIREAGRNR